MYSITLITTTLTHLENERVCLGPVSAAAMLPGDAEGSFLSVDPGQAGEATAVDLRFQPGLEALTHSTAAVSRALWGVGVHAAEKMS